MYCQGGCSTNVHPAGSCNTYPTPALALGLSREPRRSSALDEIPSAGLAVRWLRLQKLSNRFTETYTAEHGADLISCESVVIENRGCGNNMIDV